MLVKFISVVSFVVFFSAQVVVAQAQPSYWEGSWTGSMIFEGTNRPSATATGEQWEVFTQTVDTSDASFEGNVNLDPNCVVDCGDTGMRGGWQSRQRGWSESGAFSSGEGGTGSVNSESVLDSGMQINGNFNFTFD